jgi:hypothetical protein
MPNMLEEFVPESRESRSSESTSAFDEAFDLLQQQPFKGSDSMQSSSQNAVNEMFGTLDLFESETTRPEPTFSRGGTGKMPTVGETLKEIPEQLGRTLGAIGDAWSHPGAVIDEAVENGRRILDNIHNGR